MPNKNNNLNKRLFSKEKDDEFYTRYEDIEKELKHYKDHFEGKTVYCNCDDPEKSNFVKYFMDNFHGLKLRKLMATHYTQKGFSHLLEYMGKTPVIVRLDHDGDFRSPQCTDLLEKADIIVTNPPFSLFRDFMQVMERCKKDFLVIGSINGVKYKHIFDMFRKNNVRIGYNKADWFIKPDGSMRHVPTFWYTSFPVNKTDVIRHMEYQKYDNVDAINVGRIQDIPKGYTGVMGVPLTYMGYHDPESYELLGRIKPSIEGRNLYERILIRAIPGKEWKKGFADTFGMVNHC